MTGITSYPWAVNLVFRDTGRNSDLFHCGGSLISDRHVLTAAHCFDSLSDDYKLQHIRLGEWNFQTELDCDYEDYCNGPILELGFEKIVSHADYNKKTLLNDIAMVKLNRSIEFTEAISPVCLPLSEELRNIKIENTRFTVVGWRNNRHRNGTYEHASSIKLHDWSLAGVDQESCSNMISEAVDFSQLCAIGEDTCRGDSGSGLIKKVDGYYYAYGIASWGCGRKDAPTIYTKVTKFLSWIDENMAE